MTQAQPPNDQLAEQSVLGAMMMSPTAIASVSGILRPEDFYQPTYSDIFTAIMAVAGEGGGVDPITVDAELKRRGKRSDPINLFAMIEMTPTAANVQYHARIVAEKAKLRSMAELGARLRQLAFTETTSSEDVYALLGEGEKLFREQHQTDDRAADFDTLVSSWRDWQKNPETFIPTPWDNFNDLLNGGLQRGRFYVIAARPGVGKSVTALNIAQHAAYWDFPSAFFSLEMDKDEVTSRLLASGAKANLSQILRKRLEPETLAKINTYVTENSGMPIEVIDRSRVTVEQIVSHCRSIDKLAVVVVDYLGLLTATDARVSRQEQISHISRQLKIAAGELNVAMIACSQLNRQSVKEGKPRAPTIADLRDSGAVEQDADCVVLLHKDEDDPGFVSMIVGKNRQGKEGQLALGFSGQYAQMLQ